MTNCDWRANVDLNIRRLWVGLKYLHAQDEARFTDADADLWFAVTKHPEIQCILETARKFEKEYNE